MVPRFFREEVNCQYRLHTFSKRPNPSEHLLKLRGGASRVPFAFTKGLNYRVHNFGTNSAYVYTATSGVAPLISISAGATADFTSTQDTYWLEAYSTDAHLLVEPLITTLWSGIAMSPLSYVVQMASAENVTFVGTFYSAGGAALVPPGATDAVVTVAATADPETLGYLMFGTDSMWVDAVEFRGVLQGGPVLVVEGSPAANVSAPETGYSPLPNGLTIQPGPVIIGPNGVEQPARNTGTCVEPTAALFDTNISKEVSFPYDVDVTGVGLARVYVEWFLNSESNGDLTISAYPMCYPGDADPKVSSNPGVQETFFLTEGGAVNHIELDPGKYRLVFSTEQTQDIYCFAWVQRLQ